jgi:predicted nucleic acid-binding protein
MGTLLDTTVFIDLERAVRRLPPENAMADVHRAAPEHRARREAFVEATAVAAGWRVGTANLRHFDRIVGLDVLNVTFAG